MFTSDSDALFSVDIFIANASRSDKGGDGFCPNTYVTLKFLFTDFSSDRQLMTLKRDFIDAKSKICF